MDSDIYCRTIHFLSLDSLDVNYILLAIDLDDLTNLLAFVVTSNNLTVTKIWIARYKIQLHSTCAKSCHNTNSAFMNRHILSVTNCHTTGK